MSNTTFCLEVFTADDDMFYDLMREYDDEVRFDILTDHGEVKGQINPKLFKFDDITYGLAQSMFDCWIREPNVVHAVLYEDWKESDDPEWPDETSGNVIDRWDRYWYSTPSASAINAVIENVPSNGSPLLEKWALRCQDNQ